MKIIKNLKYIPKKAIRLGIVSIIASVLAIAAEYSLAQLIQIYTYALGFIKVEQINPKLHFLIETEQRFFIVLISGIFFRGLAQFLLNFINVAFAETFIYEMRNYFLDKIFDPTQASNYNLGKASNLFAEIIPKAAAYVTGLARIVTLSIQSFGLGLICFISLPREFISSAVTFIVIAPLVFYLNRKSKLFSIVLLVQSTRLNNQLMSSIKNFLFIKILGIEHQELLKTKEHTQKYYSAFMKNNVINSITNSLPNTIGIAIVFLLFYYFNQKGTSSAELLGLFYLLNRFIQSSSQLIGQINQVTIKAPNFDAIVELIKQAKDVKKKREDLIECHAEIKSFDLSVKQLSFKYDTTPIFEDLSFKLKANQILVIKGKSGSGKSTLLMSLIGLIQPQSGKIMWGTQEFSQIPKDLFKSHIGYLGPEPFIINGSIYENVTYGIKSEVSEEEILQACSLAKADQFVNESQKGLQTILSEQGEGLSMGQKQRLGLARALLRKPKILVLDEVTANLDHATEKAIVQNVESLKKEMTILIATHSSAFDGIADQKIEF